MIRQTSGTHSWLGSLFSLWYPEVCNITDKLRLETRPRGLLLIQDLWDFEFYSHMWILETTACKLQLCSCCSTSEGTLARVYISSPGVWRMERVPAICWDSFGQGLTLHFGSFHFPDCLFVLYYSSDPPKCNGCFECSSNVLHHTGLIEKLNTSKFIFVIVEREKKKLGYFVAM